LALAARVYDPKSGRVMEALTTEPGVQVYTALHFDGFTGKGGAKYEKYGALCLEMQHFPDSINKPNFPTTVLRPGGIYRQTTEYRFSVR
jgi:aldose 1-epimerase